MIIWEKTLSENTDSNVKYFSEEEFHNIKQKALKNQFIINATLQEIIDNIFKHNILDQEKPIEIKISIEENYLNIYNSINLQNNVVSNKTGLINILIKIH